MRTKLLRHKAAGSCQLLKGKFEPASLGRLNQREIMVRWYAPPDTPRVDGGVWKGKVVSNVLDGRPYVSDVLHGAILRKLRSISQSENRQVTSAFCAGIMAGQK